MPRLSAIVPATDRPATLDRCVAAIEDVELGDRLAARGARIELDPAIRGTHLKAWTLTSMVRTDLVARGIPWVELLLAGGRHSTALNLGWRHRASAAASLGCLGALARRKRGGVTAAAIALVALNRGFYVLLVRERGPAQALAGVGLHVVHHATAAAAVPAGVLRHIVKTR